jgi:NADH-quinone oxidoreductase subunit N
VKLFEFDGLSSYYRTLILSCSLVVALFSRAGVSGGKRLRGEFYVFLLLGSLGAMLLASSNHFVSLFLGLELLSVSLYTLVAFLRTDGLSIEAGLKYLVAASIASAFLLLGMALTYFDKGAMEFDKVRLLVCVAPSALSTAGLLLIVAGLAFKLALAPFHFWAPDVYQGACPAATAFIATVSKTAVFAVIFRLFAPMEHFPGASTHAALVSMAIASMLGGNFLALRQQNIRRIIAYSSIAHAGYFMAGFLCDSSLGIRSATLYITVYMASVLGVLGAASLLSGKDLLVNDLAVCARKKPFIAAVMALSLLSLAGLPLTSGFMGKFYTVTAGVQGKTWFLTASLLLGSVVGLGYYLRIVFALFDRPQPLKGPMLGVGVQEIEESRSSISANLALGIITVLIIAVGIFPGVLFDIIHRLHIG